MTQSEDQKINVNLEWPNGGCVCHTWIYHAGPFIVRAEVTADNTSIRVSWEWSCQGVPMHINLVRVDYQPEGGSLMMQAVGSRIATSATLPNLQCNTKYTIWVYASGGQINTTSTPRMVSLPSRGMYNVMLFTPSYSSL